MLSVYLSEMSVLAECKIVLVWSDWRTSVWRVGVKLKYEVLVEVWNTWRDVGTRERLAPTLHTLLLQSLHTRTILHSHSTDISLKYTLNIHITN